MKFKILIYLVSFFLLTSLNVFSQIKITGKIINSSDNNPVEFAEIILQTKDSVTIKSELSNENGNFQIDTKSGNYILQIKQFGNILYNTDLFLEKTINLGIIKTKTFNNLKEVIITSKKKLIERKIDRLVFNVENSISTTGGDALDALKLTPGLRVQNDQIKMIGKSGMAVMVGDRLIQLTGDDLINFLKTIPSDNIKSIEVITTPPAKYEAEGNSGLINIKLKKAKKYSWNTSINSAYRQATYSIGSIGANFNYQKNKLSFFSNINSSNGATAPIETSKIYYPNQIWSNNSQRKDIYKTIGGRVGIDYQITKKWTMGIQYLGSNSKPNINENNNTTITNNNSNSIDSFIKTDAENFRKNNSNSLNYHTIYDVDTLGTKISADFDYFKYNGNDNRTFKSNSLSPDNNTIQNSYFSANNGSENNLFNYSAKIDVEMRFKLINLTYGGKFSSTKNNSDVIYYDLTSGSPIYDPTQSSKFKYIENIGALYFSGRKKLNDKWETQAGLRIESTNTKGLSLTLNQENSNNYIRFFPTAYITYAHNEKNIFSLNYNKRINRPTYFGLNPFRWYSNLYSYSEGNPFLQPSFTHNLEISYTHNQDWENKIYATKLINGFGQLTVINSITNIEVVRFSNFYNTEIIGFSESYTFKKIKGLESVNAVDISYANTESKIASTNPKREGFNSYFSTNNTFNLNNPKTVIFNLYFWISPAGVSDLDKSTTFSQLDLALKLLFLQKNLQLSIIGNDVFSSNRPTYISTSNNISAKYKSYYDNRYFRLSISYKFGNKNVNVEKRNFGNEDEKGRVK